MARYDRIASLPLPTRDSAFPGWLTLADLAGREREAELGRRARLRFLALRPVLRLLERGFDQVPRDSYERQIDRVREELGGLAARDAERVGLARFLNAIRAAEPGAVVEATLDMGGAIEEGGHVRAAEEFYRTALAAAQAHRLGGERIRALRLLGRLCRRSDRSDEAEALYQRAAALALALGDRGQWGRAMAGLASVQRHVGRIDEARAALEQALATGRDWQDATTIAAAAGELCALELDGDRPEHALEHGWTAIQQTAGAERDELLELVGDAFGRLGLHAAADRCYELLSGHDSRENARRRALPERATPVEPGPAALRIAAEVETFESARAGS